MQEMPNFTQLFRAAVLLREGIIPTESNKSNDSLRICSGCQKLFPVKRAEKASSKLTGVSSFERCSAEGTVATPFLGRDFTLTFFQLSSFWG
jgi:hypothetical protein